MLKGTSLHHSAWNEPQFGRIALVANKLCTAKKTVNKSSSDLFVDIKTIKIKVIDIQTLQL